MKIGDKVEIKRVTRAKNARIVAKAWKKDYWSVEYELEANGESATFRQSYREKDLKLV